jgi:methyl-accepting chemotaxis protein PixJ
MTTQHSSSSAINHAISNISNVSNNHGINSNTANFTNSLIGNIFQKLRNVKTKEEIFQASIEIIHQVLQCDRVVVYSLQPDSYCQVTAEAVTSGYAQILGKTIKDTCFESGYIEKYQKGRVRAIADIYNVGMDYCYLEKLENIQVKANLVAPLINRDRSLLGLLVVHQCGSTRQWQQSEIDFLLKIADWTMEQAEQKEQYFNLHQQVEKTQQHQKVLEQIIREIHGAIDSDVILQLATERAKELLQCDRVVAYSLEAHNMGEIIAESTIPSLAPILGKVIVDPCFEYRYLEKYQDGRVRAMNNIYESKISPCYQETLEEIAVKSNLVVPINLDDGTIYGLLIAHQCFEFRDWQPEDIDGLQKIAFHAGLSLSKATLKVKQQLVELNLPKLDNAKERLVKAKSQLQKIQEPLADTSNILVEISNLNKLLNREINLINTNGSLQTRKDIKLIQLFIKKLALNTIKLQTSLGGFDENSDIIDVIIEDLTTSLQDL